MKMMMMLHHHQHHHQQWIRKSLNRCVSSSSSKRESIATSVTTTASSSRSTMLPAALVSQLRIYDELSKSKLSALVVMTTGAGFLMAGGPISWSSLTAACVGTSLAASSANTFNQVWEIQQDKLMNRTFQRPLPSNRISPRHALLWGTTTGVASTAILAVGCNPLTAALGAFNIGLYSLVYTPMKTRLELNTWVGSVVGAIPPMMGWAAATGSILAPEAALVGGLLYLWQFPHFFALSWRLRKDYARGGFKMIPCADPTGQRTADLIWRYSSYLMAVPIGATLSGLTSSMFALEGVAINSYLMYQSLKFKQNPNNGHAKQVFLCSLWYLPMMLGCMVFHSDHWGQKQQDQELKDSSSPIQQIRDRLKGICVHEYLWPAGRRRHETTAAASLCCPVGAIENVTEKSTEIVQVVKPQL